MTHAENMSAYQLPRLRAHLVYLEGELAKARARLLDAGADQSTPLLIIQSSKSTVIYWRDRVRSCRADIDRMGMPSPDLPHAPGEQFLGHFRETDPTTGRGMVIEYEAI